MKIIAFMEKRDQAAQIEKILRHCGLWTQTSARAPPAEPASVQMELLYVADGEPCPYDATA